MLALGTRSLRKGQGLWVFLTLWVTNLENLSFYFYLFILSGLSLCHEWPINFWPTCRIHISEEIISATYTESLTKLIILWSRSLPSAWSVLPTSPAWWKAHPRGISLQPPLSGSLPSLNFLDTVRILAPIALQILLCDPAYFNDMLGAFGYR